MVSKQEMIQVLENALSTGGDFAELFFEDREENIIPCINKAIQGIKSVRIYGAGLYLLSGTKSVYTYSNDTSFFSLMELARKASEMIELGQAKLQRKTIVPESREFVNPNNILIYPSQVENKRKVNILLEADLAARSAGPLIQQLNIHYFDTDQRICIVNSEGLFTKERRITSRLRFQAAVGEGIHNFSHWEDFTRPQGFEAFQNTSGYTEFAKNLVLRIENMRNAVSVKPCTVPVVLEAGACGTLWHESCGHSLEACAIASRSSAFVDKIGEMVASPKVTLIDDGTMPGYYGSSGIDDEGHPRQKNVLIENGVLRQYMCDRLHGRMLGMESNGCGRRQNYTFAPTSRMSNTYLASGTDDEEEMIQSVPEGLYVRSIGGGYGGMQFSLIANEGFWIKNGQISHQVKGIMLTGNGLDVIKKIDRVGKTVGYDGGGFCGASSGLIPVTTMQPRVRISEMTIG